MGKSPYAPAGNQHLVSMFGRQPASHRATASFTKFGTGTRDAAQKIFISKEHSAQGGGTSPGPVYDSKSAIGKQSDSMNETLPSWRFGSVDRSRLGNRMTNIHTTDVGLTTAAIPGPGAYNQPTGFGKQPDSHINSNPIYSFEHSTREQAGKVFQSKKHEDSFAGKGVPGAGTYQHYSMNGKQADAAKPSAPYAAFIKADRFRYPEIERAKHLPAPGDYKAASGVGLQVLSRTTSMPRYGFGTTERDQRDKMFISKEHEKAIYGRVGPGPCGYQHKSSIGPQVTSVMVSSASFGFGKQSRFGPENTMTRGPGPGAYNA